MNILDSIILGLVQGLTEFIPVSSSGHLEIVQHLLGARGDNFHFFLELINFGTLLALLIFYRKRIAKILRDIFKNRDYKLAINILLTSIPAGLIGLLLSDIIKSHAFFSSLITVAIAMGVVGLLMVMVDRLPHRKAVKSSDDIEPSHALTIGLAQTFALVPGVSRSGSTIIAGRLSGLSARLAADYSFLCSIPLMLAVCGKSLLSSTSRAYISENLPALLVSNAVAFLSGYLALHFVLKFLKKPGTLKYFGFYRLILSVIVIVIYII